MASNVDKVEEKAEEDLERAVRTSKSREEVERKLDPRDVSYKIKDETKEGKKQEYRPNQPKRAKRRPDETRLRLMQAQLQGHRRAYAPTHNIQELIYAFFHGYCSTPVRRAHDAAAVNGAAEILAV